MTLTAFLAFAFLTLLGAISPGPAVLMSARTGLTEREATTAGFDAVAEVIQGTSRAHYYPDGAPMAVKVVAERVQYFDANGKLITESLKDYTRNTLAKEFESLDDFLRHWSKAEKKQAIIDELAHQGIFFEALAEEELKLWEGRED